MPSPIEGGNIGFGYGAGYGADAAAVGAYGSHGGVDYPTPTGTPVRATTGGYVTHAGPMGGYGNTVVVNDSDGYYHYYAHLDSLGVSTGDNIGGGAWIGNSGSTGKSTGPHLHYEVRKGGQGGTVDPTPWTSMEGWSEGGGGGPQGGWGFDRNVPPPDAADYWIQERNEDGQPVGEPYFDHEGYEDALSSYQHIATGGAGGGGLHQSEIDNYYSQIESRRQQSAINWGNLSARYAELGESGRQFDVSHGENVRQFDISHAEGQRQFDVTEQRMRRAQEFEERATRANAIIDELDMRIRAGEMSLNQATAEFNRRFNTAELQASVLRDFAPIGVPAGTEYLPGFEAGGPVAQLYGMAGAEYTPTKISTIGVDPMVIAQNILDTTHAGFEAASRAVVTPQQVQTGFTNALGELGMVSEQPWPGLYG